MKRFGSIFAVVLALVAFCLYSVMPVSAGQREVTRTRSLELKLSRPSLDKPLGSRLLSKIGARKGVDCTSAEAAPGCSGSTSCAGSTSCSGSVSSSCSGTLAKLPVKSSCGNTPGPAPMADAPAPAPGL